MTDLQKVIPRMKELAQLLDYRFNDILHLADAMDVTKVGDTCEPEYNSSALATVGDAVLKTILSDHLYNQGKTRGEISSIKSKMECNENLHRISEKYGLCHYTYNDDYFYDEAPGHLKLPNGMHDLYIEAIIGAVFHDLGYENCREWVEKKIVPEME